MWFEENGVLSSLFPPQIRLHILEFNNLLGNSLLESLHQMHTKSPAQN